MKAILSLLIILSAFAALPHSLNAGEKQAGTDLQLRLPFHVQAFPGWTIGEDIKLGLAGWGIFTDVTAPGAESTNLIVAGPMIEFKNGDWIEFMAGRLQSHGKSNFLVDLRFSDQVSPHLSLSGELGYFPEKKNERLYAFFIADTPVKIGSYTVRIGVELENTFSLCEKHDSIGIGPRICFPIPQKLVPKLSASLSFGYEFRNDRNFLRSYLVFSYRL